MTTLREQLNALAEEDLARLVMVTAQALNDQEWTAEIAKPCGMSQEQLEAWAERVVWKADPNATLFEAATKVLGWASPAPVMIDIAPLLPMLDTARRIRDELAESEARFQALSRTEQLEQVDSILDADRPLEKTYDGTVRALVDALLEQTAHGYSIMQAKFPIADTSQLVDQERSAEAILDNTNLKVRLGSNSPSESEGVCLYCGGDGYHEIPRTPGVDCEACKGTGKAAPRRTGQ